MTVKEFFEKYGIELFEITDSTDTNDYYTAVTKFVESVWDKELSALSDKQEEWLHKIRDDIEERDVVNENRGDIY